MICMSWILVQSLSLPAKNLPAIPRSEITGMFYLHRSLNTVFLFQLRHDSLQSRRPPPGLFLPDLYGYGKKLHYAIEYPDQDLLNYCHYQDTLFVDPFLYNLNARYGYDDYNIHYDELKQRGVIIHYASSKPWRGNFLHYDIEWLWWEYAKHTPFYRQLLEALRENIMDSPLNPYIADLAQKRRTLPET